MAQWVTVAGERRTARVRDVHLHVVKERHPPTSLDRHGAAYRMPMGDGGGSERRETWAEYLRRMTDRPGWSVARLAREAGINRATIFKWMSGKSGTNTASVKAIAQALGDDPTNALAAASNIGTKEELDPDLVIIMRRLSDPAVPAAEKTALRSALRYLAGLAEQAEQAERPGRVISPRRDRAAG